MAYRLGKRIFSLKLGFRPRYALRLKSPTWSIWLLMVCRLNTLWNNITIYQLSRLKTHCDYMSTLCFSVLTRNFVVRNFLPSNDFHVSSRNTSCRIHQCLYTCNRNHSKEIPGDRHFCQHNLWPDPQSGIFNSFLHVGV